MLKRLALDTAGNCVFLSSTSAGAALKEEILDSSWQEARNCPRSRNHETQLPGAARTICTRILRLGSDAHACSHETPISAVTHEISESSSMLS